MAVIDIEIFSGDSFSRKVTISAKDAIGTITPIPLTGFTCFFTAKKSEADGQSSAIVHKIWTDHDNATEGITTIRLTKSETVPVGSYYYAFGYYTADAQKQTLWTGKITFKKSADTSTEA